MKRAKKTGPRVPGTYSAPSCADCMRHATKLLVREGLAYREAEELARKKARMRPIGLDFRCPVCGGNLSEQIREKLEIWVRAEIVRRDARAERRAQKKT